MKNRRPRKLKKQLKKRFAIKAAFRIAQCTMVAASSLAQTAMVSAQPKEHFDPVGIAGKSFAVAGIAIDCAEKLSQIMNSGPQNWREA